MDRFELSTFRLSDECSNLLSYIPKCEGKELNFRHVDFQSTALPTELPSQSIRWLKGFEPLTCRTTIYRSADWTIATIIQENKDSNLDQRFWRPLFCQLNYSPLMEMTGVEPVSKSITHYHSLRCSPVLVVSTSPPIYSYLFIYNFIKW